MRKPFMVEFTGTPESGKTTTIKNLSNKLISNGYEVTVLQESAERLPTEIPKGTWNANLWMHFQTTAEILRASYIKADIILIDRGLLDSNFYGKKFLWEGIATKEQYEKFKSQFIEELFPDFLIALTVSPLTAIKRRGGAGHLVNENYINRYNDLFIDTIKEICNEYNRVAIFIDMDGTIVEYKIYEGEKQLIEAHEDLLNEKPVLPIIDILKEISKIQNIDLYILSLAKNTKIKEKKKEWLNKYVNFIKPTNWIIINKEAGEYNSENRNYAKYAQIEKKLKEYDIPKEIVDILKNKEIELEIEIIGE